MSGWHFETPMGSLNLATMYGDSLGSEGAEEHALEGEVRLFRGAFEGVAESVQLVGVDNEEVDQIPRYAGALRSGRQRRRIEERLEAGSLGLAQCFDGMFQEDLVLYNEDGIAGQRVGQCGLRCMVGTRDE
jgi:hypothetical protein